jgi:hypothetical protein
LKLTSAKPWHAGVQGQQAAMAPTKSVCKWVCGGGWGGANGEREINKYTHLWFCRLPNPLIEKNEGWLLRQGLDKLDVLWKQGIPVSPLKCVLAWGAGKGPTKEKGKGVM